MSDLHESESLQKTRLVLGVSLSLGVLLYLSQTLAAPRTPSPGFRNHHTQNTVNGAPTKITLPKKLHVLKVPEIQKQTSQDVWHEVKVKQGDSLSKIFSEKKIYADLIPILKSGKTAKRLKTLRPGETIRLRINSEGLEELVYQISKLEQIHFTRSETGYSAKKLSHPVEIQQVTASGIITSSLFMAGRKAGIPDPLIMDLANIFAWDIDFALDIRQGDSFSVIYEQKSLGGKKLQGANIIAAEFFNRGKIHQAFRFTDSKGNTGYYTPDGLSMRKQFLRTPVNIARVSSHFNLRRKHPVLNRIRAHRGVDYAASKGTPIKATASGKVIFHGKKGGYGNAIVLKHGTQYTTLYGHMSRFGRKTSVGSRIKQGQTIGYIGKTGLATGSHLHYEFRINGIHQDPLKVKLPTAKPLPKSELATFKSHIEPLQALLDSSKETQIATIKDNSQ